MGALRIILIVILAVCVGLAGGYLWEQKKVREVEGQMKGLMVEMERASKAAREHVQKAEANRELYKLRVLVAETRCDVMERNFGRAEERIATLESSLDKAFAPLGDQGMASRDNIKMSLEGIKEGLKKLDIKIKPKIEELGKMMDQALSP